MEQLVDILLELKKHPLEKEPGQLFQRAYGTGLVALPKHHYLKHQEKRRVHFQNSRLLIKP